MAASTTAMDQTHVGAARAASPVGPHPDVDPCWALVGLAVEDDDPSGLIATASVALQRLLGAVALTGEELGHTRRTTSGVVAPSRWPPLPPGRAWSRRPRGASDRSRTPACASGSWRSAPADTSPGAKLSGGDLRFSQGDGEITFCGAIEMGGFIDFGVDLIKDGMSKYGVTTNPILIPGRVEPRYSEFVTFIGVSVDHDTGENFYLDAAVAYRRACLNAVAYLQKFGYSGEQAYLLLGSAPIEGRVSGVVDIPNACCPLYLPTAIFDFDIRPSKEGPTSGDRGSAAKSSQIRMALYEFACDSCGSFELSRPMREAAAPSTCPDCGARARRIFTAPRLALIAAPVRGALEAEEKSAHEPSVVTRKTGRPLPHRHDPSPPWVLTH